MSSEVGSNPETSGDREHLSFPAWSIAVLLLGIGVPAYLWSSEEKIEYRRHEPVSYDRVERIVEDRCQPCHAKEPTHETVDRPPAGVTFESPAKIEKFAERIMVRVVEKKNMPRNNATGITHEEREALGAWVHQGADTDAAPTGRASRDDAP